ncbi:MAG: protoporphyrinogen/coproporphyrinogen oxidase, partial [Longimicrobiales bacterium]
GRLLAARNMSHVVFEAAPTPGGVIRSRTVEGRVVEEGPQRTRLTPAVRRLVAALELEQQLLIAPAGLPLFIYARGRLRRAPLSLSQLGSTDLFDVSAKTRVLMEPFTSPAQAEESVAGYLTRRFGAAAYEDLLGPLFGGLYAEDPADMPVRHTLAPVLRELGATRSAVLALLRRGVPGGASPPVSFRGGMRALTDALHHASIDRVRLSTPVRGLRQTGAGYTLQTDDGPIRARHVVLTVPAGEAARLLADTAPAASAAIGALRYNPIALVHMDADPSVRGLGYQVSFREALETRGVTFNHALFDRPRLYTAFLGGARNPALASADDDAIAAIATREFATVTGLAATPLNVARAWIPSWNRGWDALDRLTLPPGIHLAANYESRIGITGRLARARAVADVVSVALRDRV